MKVISPLNLSFLIHALCLAFFLMATNIHLKNNTEQINVPVVFSAPVEPMNIKEIKKESKVVLKSVNKVDLSIGEKRVVFGLNRNSYTENSADAGPSVKMGNTTAKSADKEILKSTDSDSLPTPTEEYLVSQMPRVLIEARPVYPEAARLKQKEGAVILNVLIDELGAVRQVEVVKSEDIFKNEAIEAIKKFKFSPANVNGKAVAVKIRYVINFKLEY